MNELTIKKMFDAHIHFRQNNVLEALVPFTARCCQYAVVMPNTEPPITQPTQLAAYRASVLKASSAYPSFKPLFMAYLTETTTKEDVQAMAAAGAVGYKIYPQNKGRNGTTGSKHGISATAFRHPSPTLHDALDEIPKQNLITSCHAEWPDTYFLDAEIAYLESAFMHNLLVTHKIVIEHVCSMAGVNWIRRMRRSYNVWGSITLHHMFMDTDDVLGQNDNFCRPPAHTPSDRYHLQNTALRGEDGFFMGSDSAWHPSWNKYTAFACAGCFTAPALVERLLHMFVEAGKFEKAWIHPAFDAFTYGNACKCYSMPEPTEEITLVHEPWSLEGPYILFGLADDATPWWKHEKVQWRIKEA